MKEIIDKLIRDKTLDRQEWTDLLNQMDEQDREYLKRQAQEAAHKRFGNKIFVRGLIEFTNYCKNDCYYCGIRRSNPTAERYRLTKEEILDCCEQGYQLGFRTFVLQGGEDPWYTDEKMEEIISLIKKKYPDCALTLSIGEKTMDQYLRYHQAGADRYLLRHETTNPEHYSRLHPTQLSAENRKRCLFDLKKAGFQVGAGFMVGSPFQTVGNIVEDLLFLKELEPEMVGIGPFIPHKDTPFSNFPAGSMEQTLVLIAMVRLMLPDALIPSTTALGTVDPNGREWGILSGANVIMPNLSPVINRKKYQLYDNKICTGEEAAECKGCLEKRLARIGYEIVTDRGDFRKKELI